MCVLYFSTLKKTGQLVPSLIHVMQTLNQDPGALRRGQLQRKDYQTYHLKRYRNLYLSQRESQTSTPTAFEGNISSSDDEPETEKGTQTSPQKECKDYGFASTPKVKCKICDYNTVPSKEEIKQISKGRFIQTIQSNDKPCFHYTGIPKVALLLQLFIWLEPLTSKIKLWDRQKKFETSGRSGARRRRALTSFEEFCLTLVRIRRGYDVVLLSHLFGISRVMYAEFYNHGLTF